MSFKKLCLATGAAALAIAPVAASAEVVDRSSAEVAQEESLAGRGSSTILAVLALAAVVAGIIIAIDDDEDSPVSV